MNDSLAPRQADDDLPGAQGSPGASGAPDAAGSPAAAGSDKPPADVASFVLRFSQDLWREAGGQPRVRWRGHIRHVQGDAEARFTDFSDAVSFMQRQLAQLTLDSVAQDDAAGQAQALSESFQVWETVTEGYRDLWLGAVRAAADGTQAMRRQVGQQLERSWPWWPFWPGGAAGGGGAAAGQEAGGRGATGEVAGDPAAGASQSSPSSPSSPSDPAAAALPPLLDVLAAIQAQLSAIQQRLAALEGRGEGGRG